MYRIPAVSVLLVTFDLIAVERSRPSIDKWTEMEPVIIREMHPRGRGIGQFAVLCGRIVRREKTGAQQDQMQSYKSRDRDKGLRAHRLLLC